MTTKIRLRVCFGCLGTRSVRMMGLQTRLFFVVTIFMITFAYAGKPPPVHLEPQGDSQGSASATNEMWPIERPNGMPNIVSLEVMCGKDHMDVHLSFSQPFEGIVSSKGQHSDPRCVYVPPSTGKTFFSFRISYSRCGTKPDLNGQFYENTVVVQYDKDLLEVWDEAKRLRCEWFNDYEKTASKPPMVIADLDVIQLDFRGDNVDCWMEIQHGKGPWAPPVNGIVPLGSTLTLVVAINDFKGEFDMRVKNCVASDGAGHIIKLTDEFGCVLRPKMISKFLKARAPDERASVLTYAFFHAFKFPDALSVHIKCKVEICRHGCLDHCQLASTGGGGGSHEHNLLERKDTNFPQENMAYDSMEQGRVPDLDMLYDDIIHHAVPDQKVLRLKKEPNATTNWKDSNNNNNLPPPLKKHNRIALFDNGFPNGPRQFVGAKQDRMGRPPPPLVAGPRSMKYFNNDEARGSTVYLGRSKREADVGVSGMYDVISEADLAFNPETKQEPLTVFQGQMYEDFVSGVCMSLLSFCMIFSAATLATLIAVLFVGCLLYRLQMLNESLVKQQQQNSISSNVFGSWMTMRLFRVREMGCKQ